MAMKQLQIGDSGTAVERLQLALNSRGKPRGFPKIKVDGTYGVETDKAVERTARAMGALEATIQLPGATIGEQRMIRLIERRSPAQLARARARALAAVPPMRERAFLEAVKDLDVRERGGNNRGPEVEAIIRENAGLIGEPWCGDAVAHWYRQAGSRIVQRGWASTIWLAANLTPVRTPLRGHIVVYDFGTGGPKHAGLFDTWIDKDAGWFWAIEGNTRPGTATSDAGGGEGVHRVRRNINQVATFRRVVA